MRLLTYNVEAGGRGDAELAAEVDEYKPDVLVMQELSPQEAPVFQEHFRDYQVQSSGQFLIASRFPIKDITTPPRLSDSLVSGHHAARFVRYALQTPLGTIDLFSVHPTSPHEALNRLRGEGALREIASGRILAGRAVPSVVANAELRERQVQEIALEAKTAGHPVIIAGDTNLPELSYVFGHYLGDYQDGFAETGNGFGYTFPTTHTPWMRIDRVLASADLRFLRTFVGQGKASDHHALIADIELRKKPETP